MKNFEYWMYIAAACLLLVSVFNLPFTQAFTAIGLALLAMRLNAMIGRDQ